MREARASMAVEAGKIPSIDSYFPTAEESLNEWEDAVAIVFKFRYRDATDLSTIPENLVKDAVIKRLQSEKESIAEPSNSQLGHEGEPITDYLNTPQVPESFTYGHSSDAFDWETEETMLHGFMEELPEER